MTVINVAPSVYYQAAAICNRAATQFFTTYAEQLQAMHTTGGMAGSIGPGARWADSYDQQVTDTHSLVTGLITALDNYTEILIEAGFNYALADHDPNSHTPAPEKPPTPPVAYSQCPVPPPSAGGPGSGLIDDGVELANKIGLDLPVPDGDTTKLTTAANAWNAAATAPDTTNLARELERAAVLFQEVTAPEVSFIDEDLRELEAAAEDLRTTFTDLSTACRDQKTAHDQLRSQLEDTLEQLATEIAKEIAITLALSVAASFVSFGLGTAAVAAIRGGKAADTIAGFVTKIRAIVAAAKLKTAVSIEKPVARTRDKLQRIIDLGKKRTDATKPPKPRIEWNELFKGDRTPKATDLEKYAQEQGWVRSRTENGPVKYTDDNGVTRFTIKRGSQRTPGSETPHIEIRNTDGARIDPEGNLVTKRSPGNHTPIEMDVP